MQAPTFMGPTRGALERVDATLSNSMFAARCRSGDPPTFDRNHLPVQKSSTPQKNSAGSRALCRPVMNGTVGRPPLWQLSAALDNQLQMFPTYRDGAPGGGAQPRPHYFAEYTPSVPNRTGSFDGWVGVIYATRDLHL